MPERVLAELDLVLAGFHEDCGYLEVSVEENTRAMIAAINNPYVNIISHPGNPVFPVDIEKVVNAAALAGKALEINNKSFFLSRSGSMPNCSVFAKMAKKYKTLIAVNSDSHFCDTVGQCGYALELITAAGIEKDDVINSSVLKIKKYLGLT